MTDAQVALFLAGHLGHPDLHSFLTQVAGSCSSCRAKLDFYFPASDSGLDRYVALWTEELAGLSRLRSRAGKEPSDGADGGYARFKHIARGVHGWARIEHLIEMSRRMRRRDQGQMWLLAQGAASVASTLGARDIDRDRYTAGQKADLRARTQIELAEAQRLHGGLAHARECLGKATALVEEGRCSPRTRGRWMKVCAAVLMDQGYADEAFHLLDQLHRYYLDRGASDLAGRTLISKGIALYTCTGDRRREAAGALRQGFVSLAAG